MYSSIYKLKLIFIISGKGELSFPFYSEFMSSLIFYIDICLETRILYDHTFIITACNTLHMFNHCITN